VCGTQDVPIDAGGWVDRASTGCEIEGAWWWSKDDKGTTLEAVTANRPPFVAGQGMCIKGTTIADTSGAAWGAIIGLDLNNNQTAGWDAAGHGVVGFEVELAGTGGGADLRLELESATNRTTPTPFVPVQTGTGVALIGRAIVPLTWAVTNKGETPNASNLRKLQLHVAGGATATTFDVCVARVRPIVGACRDNDLVAAGGYQLYNNTWGKQNVTGYSECVFAGSTGADFGWLWQWPPSTPAYQVRAYPEIMAGKSPWMPVDNGHGLPAPITSDLSFTFALDLQADPTGSYDFAPEVWLTTTQEPAPQSVTHELMFWLAHNNATPAGSMLGTLTVAGVAYDVYVNPNQNPGAGAPTGWEYVAFVARTPVLGGTVHLKPFVDYLVSAGQLSGMRYYAGFELGIELTNGAGSAIFSNFSVNVAP